MNSDSESLQHQLIAWLLAKNAQTNDPKLVNCEDNEGENILMKQSPPQTVALLS